MTLIKSALLGSAAAIVVAAGAQAADLPTRKAAPVAYVQICNVGGITGWVLPGSDTCVKLSGYITAQFEGGNLSTQYNWGTVVQAVTAATNPAAPVVYRIPGAFTNPALIPAWSQVNQRVLIAQPNSFYRDETGWTTRANFGFDFASNTAYGPLIGHFDINSETGNGFDNVTHTYLNTGYLTWAGITAGKAASFYSFTGGGDNWANFASPDQKGFNEPDLLAYTASFGGGFSATIAAQSPGISLYSGGGTDMGFPNNGLIGGNGGANPVDITFGGQRWPDFVGNLHVKQGWGEAQVSGVVHNVNVRAEAPGNGQFFNSPAFLGAQTPFACGVTGTLACNGQETKTGWGIDAGVKINLPSFGAGDDFLVTGSYTQSAFWYSGLPDMMWGENGQVNGNGQPWYAADAYFNPLTNRWSAPTAWSVSALLEHHFTPQFYVDLEGSIGGVKWSNMGGGCNFAIGLAGCTIAQAVNGPLSPSTFTWLIGADIGWNPVTNLNFDLELMYQSTNQDRPSGFLGTVYNQGLVNPDGTSAAYFVPGQWHGVSDGFAGRL
ncbi:MAG TPA: porin, partial [Roseiarcus sp.]|nr:porin [Roseiarcus sp.]